MFGFPIRKQKINIKIGVFGWMFRASRFLRQSTCSIAKVLHTRNREALGVLCFIILQKKSRMHTKNREARTTQSNTPTGSYFKVISFIFAPR